MFERFTERVRKAVALVQEGAGRFWQDHIGTEHPLLGLLREEEVVAAQAPRAFGAVLHELCWQVEGVAARVRSNLDVDPDVVRREVERGLSDAGPEADPPDRVYSVLGQEEAGRYLFRGRMAGIRTELDLPRSLAVTVDAAYSYRASARFPAGWPTVDLADGPADLVHAPRSWRHIPQNLKPS